MKQLAIVITIVFFGAQQGYGAPVNVLANPGFETGDFTGWTVGGNSTQVGVAADGTSIPGAVVPFPPSFQNVRSGDFGGNALVKNGGFPLSNDIDRIILSQTVAVLPGQNVSIGFYMGTDSQSGYGMAQGNTTTQIFVDGVGLLNVPNQSFSAGSLATDLHLISTSFNTGTRSSLSLAFAITGSGTSLMAASFDDFFAITEQVADVPEPTSMALFGLTALGLGISRRRRKGDAVAQVA